MFFKTFPFDILEGVLLRDTVINTPADFSYILKNLRVEEFRYTCEMSKENFMRFVTDNAGSASQMAPVYYKIEITRNGEGEFKFEKKVWSFPFTYHPYGGRSIPPYFVAAVATANNKTSVILKYGLGEAEVGISYMLLLPFFCALSFALGAGCQPANMLGSLVFLLLPFFYLLKRAHDKLALKVDFESMFGLQEVK